MEEWWGFVKACDRCRNFFHYADKYGLEESVIIAELQKEFFHGGSWGLIKIEEGRKYLLDPHVIYSGSMYMNKYKKQKAIRNLIKQKVLMKKKFFYQEGREHTGYAFVRQAEFLGEKVEKSLDEFSLKI